MSQLLQVATRSGALPTVDGVAAPDHFDQGIPYDTTGVAVDSVSAIDHHHQGLPFTAAGRLAVEQAAPVRYGSGATPFTASGRIAMDTSPVDHFSAGIPYNAAGGIAVTGLAPFLGVTIITQPVSLVVDQPDPAVFFVEASSGDATPLTYQWQIFTGTWMDLIGETTDTLTIDPSNPTDDGSYRCEVSNDTGTTITNTVTLLVNPVGGETFFMLTELGDRMLTEDTSDFMITEDAP